jgi:hypothetical protein
MNQQCSDAWGQVCRLTPRQPVDLCAGSREALNSVRSRNHHQHTAGVARPQPRHVGAQFFAIRPELRMAKGLHLAARIDSSRQKLPARLSVAVTEALERVHAHAYSQWVKILIERRIV